ncbi:peptidoglycan DD-metalloendopeptidase family protein [Paraburkholderia sp. A3RO-2L]|uniref:peptidoglycan DD-metalloendopeptidase family protein n=1 Tax=unclassified Paraburkholderia TaxID=2615204 RepID=UPI003DAA0716
MPWHNPLPFKLRATPDLMSFQSMAADETGLPLAPHPGAFGVRRANHTHEGVDLYAPEGTPVSAVEAGLVVAVVPFTGPHAGLPWWLDTWAVFVEGPSGVVVYGEIAPSVREGDKLAAGQLLGTVLTVLAKDKGRPRAMLHLELHRAGSRSAPEWLEHDARPDVLLDPTPHLLKVAAAAG